MTHFSQGRFDIRQAARRILVALALAAGFDLVFYVAFTRPAIVEYRRLEFTTRPDFNALKKTEEAVKKLERFRDGLHTAESDLRRLREEVLSSRNARLVEVQAEVADICSEFHIDLESVGYSHELLLDEGLDRLEMNVPLEGGYANLRKFLQAVEDSDKFLLIERVALAKGKQGGRLLDLNISLATYFTAPEELVEAAARESAGRRRRR